MNDSYDVKRASSWSSGRHIMAENTLRLNPLCVQWAAGAMVVTYPSVMAEKFQYPTQVTSVLSKVFRLEGT